MKNTLFLTAIILFAGCGNSQQQDKQVEQNLNEQFIKNVNASEFKQLVDAGNGIILDVRTPQEVSEGYINNASTINIYDEDFSKTEKKNGSTTE